MNKVPCSKCRLSVQLGRYACGDRKCGSDGKATFRMQMGGEKQEEVFMQRSSRMVEGFVFFKCLYVSSFVTILCMCKTCATGKRLAQCELQQFFFILR